MKTPAQSSYDAGVALCRVATGGFEPEALRSMLGKALRGLRRYTGNPVGFEHQCGIADGLADALIARAGPPPPPEAFAWQDSGR